MASKLDIKLDYLNETKDLITRALESKGVEFTVGDTFRDYVTKIENLRIAEDQSDATAKADEIMLNKTAYVNNVKVTGTLRPYDNNDGTGEFIVGPEIPPYTKLEYIENSNENQYIDIGVRATSDVGIELDVQTTNTNSIGFCGAWSNGTGILFGQHNQYGDQGAGYYMAGNGTWTYSGVAFDDTVFHKFIYDPVNNEISVDGTPVNINKNTGNSLNICLFRAYNWGEKSTGVRISNCKIYANGSLIKNLIPVIRTSDKKVCMFDLVGEKYYTASEGEFIAGPKL